MLQHFQHSETELIMTVLPRLSVSHKTPRANAAEHGQLCTQTSVATAVGITFTTTVLVFLLATLCLRKLGCCARDREKSTTRDFDGTLLHDVHPSGPDFGRYSVCRAPARYHRTYLLNPICHGAILYRSHSQHQEIHRLNRRNRKPSSRRARYHQIL